MKNPNNPLLTQKATDILSDRDMGALSIKNTKLPEVLFVTSFPPRECDVAERSQQLVKMLNKLFYNSFKIRICALENEFEIHKYPKEVKYVLNTQHCKAFRSLANIINLDERIKIVVFEHEFRFFDNCREDLIGLLSTVKKTKLTVFHTAVADPDEQIKNDVTQIAQHSDVVLTTDDAAAAILAGTYDISSKKIESLPQTNVADTAISYARIMEKVSDGNIRLRYRLPEIRLEQVVGMTDDFGILRHANDTAPDNGYTLDDNALALLAMCQHYELTHDASDISFIARYLDFVGYCQQADGNFFNYVSQQKLFTVENQECNLDDANGRAVWALGYLISIGKLLPGDIVAKAEDILEKALINIEMIHSPRAMAFVVKGLYYYNLQNNSKAVRHLIKTLADRLTQMYLHQSAKDWQWFEPSFSYANSLLPEALIYAYRTAGEEMYKDVARASFSFLLSNIFTPEMEIDPESNRNWQERGKTPAFGEQPSDVAYTIFALGNFYNLFRDKVFLRKMEIAFEWFLGRNHRSQIMYEPSSGACFERLQRDSQSGSISAESTLSFLLSRLCVEKNYQINALRESKIRRLKQENYAFKV